MNKALVLEQEEKKTLAGVRNLEANELPEGDVLVNIDYSSLNYKDALAVTGAGKIVHQFPMVPGIDLAGTVAESDNPDYKAGDAVVLTGWSVGEKYWGGYA
ncbi:MAG: alcohol dehydrogenase catalytic domain-containing protein, partial [Oceanospirillum sp.]|nr:alcohol dehydrogenase catalytic domain-containing protein [Oceanospirillum sp.]